MGKIRLYYSIVKNGIKNLIDWLPIIWRDRDWDEAYIYFMLHKKISRMEELFRSDDVYTAKADEVAEQLKVVKEALNRLIKDEYYEKACEAYHVEPYSNSYIRREIFDFEEELRMNDIRLVFSKNVSEQIQGWWD